MTITDTLPTTTLNALAILDKFSIQLDAQRLRKNGEEIAAYCCFHDGHGLDININVESGVYHCFGCGAKGRIWDIVAEYTNLTPDEARKACDDGLDRDVHLKSRPQFKRKKPSKNRSRYLTEPEIDMLTAYTEGYHSILMGENVPGAPNIAKRQTYLHNRVISPEAIEHFKLGTNMESYNEYFTQSQGDRFRVYGSQWNSFLNNVKLVNSRGGDYWWSPMISLPYMYAGRVYYVNTRLLPGHDDTMRYMGMSGIVRAMFFNEDALDEGHDSLYVVEGEFNAIKMWDTGFKNVVSFGGKSQFSDGLIGKLYGSHVILYFDTDANDPESKQRGEAIQKLLNEAKSISYFELPQDVDVNDYLNSHTRQEFEDNILSNIVTVSSADEFSPGEYRIIPESQRKEVISLSQAQDRTSKRMQNVADNFPSYSGKRVLVKTPVGAGKTTGATNVVNSRNHGRALILTSTHYNAQEYEDRLSFDTFSLHLKGRAHPDVECEYADMANIYASRGYSLMFRMKYCYGVCGRARELEAGKERALYEDDPELADIGCLYLRQLEAARVAETLIATHAHGQLRDFLINPYYGNERRSLVIVDEEADLIQNVYFSRKAIRYNRDLFADVAKILTENGTNETGAGAIELATMLDDMEKTRHAREGYVSDLESIAGQVVYDLDKAIYRMLRDDKGIPQGTCKLYDMAYAINNGLPFYYDESVDSLFYTWRATFTEKACVIFMSATTPRAYLEAALDIKLDEVVGEQYHVKRDNLQVIQLLNVAGGRGRVLYDTKMQTNIKTLFRLALEKHQGQRIMMITSQGTGKGLDEDDSVKDSVIAMLNPIADEAGKKLLPISTPDLEEGNIPSSSTYIPVIHYGIQGTNLFSDYDVLIELNAHYYHQQAIIDGVHKLYGVDISEAKPVKQEVPFKTWDKEYTVERYVYPDDRVGIYIEATQMADIQQAEGRILRGEDTPKVIYRLHNVNVSPYPDRIYKSWATMFKAEFNHAEITGKLADVLEWIQEHVDQGQEFTTKQVADSIGGYVQNINRRYMGQLEGLEYIENVAKGRGTETRWKRLV